MANTIMNNKETAVDLILDDVEKVAFQMFVDNEKQFNAVKKILLWEMYQNGTLKKGEPATPLRNSALGLAAIMDEPTKIGQRLMAMWEGINFLEGGFKQLLRYSRKDEPENKKENPAR